MHAAFPPGNRPDDAPSEGLALIGYRGTGKTTVGQRLACRLGRPYADADVVLQESLGRSIRDIFEREGEPAFRDHEQAVLATLTRRPGLILATGGGVVLREVNRRMLRDFGTVIWLRADAEAIVRRLQADTLADRPALTDAGMLDEVAQLLRQREPLYREVADAEVLTTGRTPDEVAEAVFHAWIGGSRRSRIVNGTRHAAGGGA